MNGYFSFQFCSTVPIRRFMCKYAYFSNIQDISQTVLDEYFNMVLIADISSATCSFEKLSAELSALGEKLGLQIRIQRSEIFEAMYQV